MDKDVTANGCLGNGGLALTGLGHPVHAPQIGRLTVEFAAQCLQGGETDRLGPVRFQDRKIGQGDADPARQFGQADSTVEQFDCHGWPARQAMGDSVLLPLIVSIYPRRDPSFQVTGTMDGHEFSPRIHNPDPFRDKVSGLPSAIPITNALGDVDVVLRSGRYTTFEWGDGPEFEFEFREIGTNATDQFQEWWIVSDVTGNKGWRVPTNEPLWMVDVSCFRSRPIAWPRHRYHHFSTRNMLAPMTYFTKTSNVQVVDTHIKKVWLGGPGTFTWIDGEIVSVTDPPTDGKNQPYHGSTVSGGKQKLEWGRAEPWVMVDTSTFDHSKHYLSVFLIDSSGNAPVVLRHTKVTWAPLNATIFRLPADCRPEEDGLTNDNRTPWRCVWAFHSGRKRLNSNFHGTLPQSVPR